jgi:hypothetical protein
MAKPASRSARPMSASTKPAGDAHKTVQSPNVVAKAAGHKIA